MYLSSESEVVCSEYKKIVKAKSKKLTKIWSYIFVGYLLVMLSILLITNFLEKNEILKMAYFLYGGVIFVGISIALLVSIFSISEAPAFNYLYKEIYEKINQDSGTFYNYISLEKGKLEFNKNGGLFPKYCQTMIKRHISGMSPNNNGFDVFDVTLVSGSGNSRQVHFSGMYFFTKFSSVYHSQIRSHSKPHLKGIKYIRDDSIDEYRVYVEENRSITNREYKYIELLEKLKRDFKAKKIYLSITLNEIHFAYLPLVHIRKQTDLDIDKMNAIYKSFIDEIKIIDELVEASEF